MTIEESIRLAVREEVRTIVREEIRAALAELRPAQAGEGALLTIDQVAQRAGGVRPATVRAWISAGRLEARRAGRRHLVSAAALDAFLIGSAATQQATINPDRHLTTLLGRVGRKRSTR